MVETERVSSYITLYDSLEVLSGLLAWALGSVCFITNVLLFLSPKLSKSK